MELNLSGEDARALKEALDVHLHELDHELAGTSKRELQRELHATWNRLDAIRNRLGELLTEEGPEPGGAAGPGARLPHAP